MARPYHFTNNPTSNGWTNQAGNAAHWSQSGSIYTCGQGTNSEHHVIRDTDESTNQTVRVRCRQNNVSGNAEGGVFCNWQDSTHNYLIYFRNSNGTLVCALYNGGYSEIATFTMTQTSGQWYDLKVTTTTNGSNKDINVYVDGTLRISVSTSTVYGSEQAGIFGNGRAVGTFDFEWWTYDMNQSLSSVNPPSGSTSGGTSVTLTGNDLGDGTLVQFNGNAATNISVTPNTTITCSTPSSAFEGMVGVKVLFGTDASEEYTYTLSNGYTYSNTSFGRVNMKLLGARLNL